MRKIILTIGIIFCTLLSFSQGATYGYIKVDYIRGRVDTVEIDSACIFSNSMKVSGPSIMISKSNDGSTNILSLYNNLDALQFHINDSGLITTTGCFDINSPLTELTLFKYHQEKAIGFGDVAKTTWYSGLLAGDALIAGNSRNALIGIQAGEELTTGDDNTFGGQRSGDGFTTENNNTGWGSYSLEGSSGTGNTGVGVSVFRTSAGNYNTDNGYFSGSLSLGNYNIRIGSEAGASHVGSYCVIIGPKAGDDSHTEESILIGKDCGKDLYEDYVLLVETSDDTLTPLIKGHFIDKEIKFNATVISSTDTIPDNDVTPDISEKNVWTYNGWANAVTITDLDNPVAGAIYTIIGNSDTYTITINDAGNFNLSAAWVGGIDDVLTLFCVADNDYIEISRSDN